MNDKSKEAIAKDILKTIKHNLKEKPQRVQALHDLLNELDTLVEPFTQPVTLDQVAYNMGAIDTAKIMRTKLLYALTGSIGPLIEDDYAVRLAENASKFNIIIEPVS